MKKKILISILALLLLFVLTFSITSCIIANRTITTTTTSIRNQSNNIQNPDDPNRVPLDYSGSFYLIDALFQNFSIFDVDYETAMLAAIRAYVEATGDQYAMYYTPEEFEDMQSENNGDLYGVGVQVIFDYDEHFMEVVLIMPDSPAEAYLQVGDIVTHVFIDGEKIAIADIVTENIEKARKIYPGYNEEQLNNYACYETFEYVVSNLKGPAGTYAEFTIVRDGVSYDLKVQRAKVKTLSVTGKVSITEPTVGIVSISQFDLTTPIQFKESMDYLIAQGCDKFVFDMRNNPGGDVSSVVAVLSTLLTKDSVIVSTKDYSGAVETIKVETRNYGANSSYVSCNVTSADIGKYNGYEFVVLANENTASAAEIFTAALRDHNLAQIVGVKTYGKGSIQSVIPLNLYGEDYYGALKLTTKLYFPPCGEGYDGGIGIAPNYVLELEGIAAEINFYKLTEDIDNQLQKAVSVLID